MNPEWVLTKQKYLNEDEVRRLRRTCEDAAIVAEAKGQMLAIRDWMIHRQFVQFPFVVDYKILTIQTPVRRLKMCSLFVYNRSLAGVNINGFQPTDYRCFLRIQIHN